MPVADRFGANFRGDTVTKLVAYFRVSTQKQGATGLGMDAQRAAVDAYAASVGGVVVADYVEVETGTRASLKNRPELETALRITRRAGARLVIAKLDRLARNVHFLSGLMEAGVDFVCCDNPHATPLTIHILAAVAEDETKRISERTRAALAAFVAGARVPRRVRELYPKGVPAKVAAATAGKLGGSLPQCRNLTPEAAAKGRAMGNAAGAAAAAGLVEDLGPLALELRKAGETLSAVAEAMNARGFVTRAGKPFTATAVLRILNRL